MSNRKDRLSFLGVMVMVGLLFWVRTVYAEDDFFGRINQPHLIQLAALDVQPPVAQQTNKPKAVAKVPLSAAIEKQNDIKKFATMWALLLSAGLVIWYLWYRSKLWRRRERFISETENVAVIDDQVSSSEVNLTREKFLLAAMEWQDKYGLSPVNLLVLATVDAALLVGMQAEAFAYFMQEKGSTPAMKMDFIHEEVRYLVKTSRQYNPMGRPVVQYVSKAQHRDWDYIVFILYDAEYSIIGAWKISAHEYLQKCDGLEKLKSEDYQIGNKIHSG